MSLAGEHKRWFINRGILLPLRNRGEVLVWRSLARKTFVLNGVAGGESRKAPTFSLHDVLQLVQFLERRRLHGDGKPSNPVLNGQAQASSIFAFGNNANNSSASSAPQSEDYVDADFEGVERDPHASSLPTMLDVEAMLASLIDQGLLRGFLSHKVLRFAILGSKTKGALNAGFPSPWTILQQRAAQMGQDRVVPGWVQEEGQAPTMAARAFGPGMVVNLSGARPAGSPFG